jgi:hypothetical protein
MNPTHIVLRRVRISPKLQYLPGDEVDASVWRNARLMESVDVGQLAALGSGTDHRIEAARRARRERLQGKGAQR